MPKSFEIERARGSLPGKSGQVPINVNVSEGKGVIGQAAAGLGGAIADLGEKYYNIQAETQFSSFQRFGQEEMTKFSFWMNDNIDPDAYQKEYEKVLGRIQAAIPKNKKAARASTNWLNGRIPKWQAGVKESQQARVEDNWATELFKTKIQAEKTGITALFQSKLLAGVAKGLISKEDAAKMAHETALNAQMNKASVRPDLMISYIDAELKSRKDGEQAIPEFATLTNTELTSVKRYATSVSNAAEVENKLLQKQTDDREGNKLLSLLINKLDPTKPQLTFDIINSNPDMSFDAKVEWFTRLRTFDNYSEQELKEAFADDGAVVAEIYDKIDSDTLTDELDTMVGKGLSPVTAQRLKTEQRKPFEARADKMFKNIFGWQPDIGFKDDFSKAFYLKVDREWREEVKRQNAMGEEIMDIGRSIARPYFVEHIDNTMSGISDADVTRMVDLALGEEAPKTEPEVPPKEDEGPATMQDLIDEVIRLQAIDEGKAKAFYDAWKDKFAETEE